MDKKISYSEKLKDPRWQKKRLEVMQRDNFKCQYCNDTETTLNVHHFFYESYNPWETELKYLVTLCQSCHQKETYNRPLAEKMVLHSLKEVNFYADDLVRIARGMSKVKIKMASEVTASLIEWILSNQQLMDQLLNDFMTRDNSD